MNSVCFFCEFPDCDLCDYQYIDDDDEEESEK